MQDLIRPDASFTPRELFARMQGAWFEPRQGSMWQEFDGKTPTTTGGQTVGLLLGLDQQAQLGPELIPDDIFSNSSYWVFYPGWSLSDNKLIGTNLGPFAQAQAHLLESKKFYQIEIDVTFDEGSIYFGYTTSPFYANGTYVFRARLNELAFDHLTINAYFQPSTTCTISRLSVREILGNHAIAIAANRPLFGARRNLLTYSEQFDNAAWGLANLSVIPNCVVSPDGQLTADKIVESTGGVLPHLCWQHLTNINGSISVFAKAGERTILEVLTYGVTPIDGESAKFAYFDLLNGTVAVGQEGSIARITPSSDGWYRCSLTGFSSSSAVQEVRFTPSIAMNGNGTLYSGDGTSGLYLWGAQLELGSVATDYQRVTTATDYDAGRFPAIRHADSTDVLTATLPDLGGGVFSAAGSVYFSTPQGMSCLHNQSIGTTYNLPALQTDIYGTVITPARLAPPLEKRLELYMHRLAGLADADFFWQEDYGPELVTNGDFSNGTTGWSATNNSLITAQNGGLRVTYGGSAYPGVDSTRFNLTVGRQYLLTYSITEYNAGGNLYVFVSSGVAGSGIRSLTLNIPDSIWSGSAIFTAVYPFSYVNVSDGTGGMGVGGYFTIDNISIREVLDGQVGQLLTDDGTILLRG